MGHVIGARGLGRHEKTCYTSKARVVVGTGAEEPLGQVRPLASNSISPMPG